jgi:hypothetical protein
MHSKSFAFISSVLILSVCASAQMIDPAIDRAGEPFSYFSHPTDVIGVMDGRAGTLISPEGYLFTGYGELMFFTGNPPQPASQRIKTLYRGYLPEVEYTYHEGAIEYRVATFAATLDGDPESPMMNFVRVVAVNTGKTAAAGHFGAAVRYTNEDNTGRGHGDYRFARPLTPARLGQPSQPGVQWNPDWQYDFTSNRVLRDGKVMYLFPVEPVPVRSLTLKQGHNEKPELTRKLKFEKTTPAGAVRYDLLLQPAAKQVLEFRMPYEPLSPDSPLLQQLERASFDDYLARTAKFWQAIFDRGLAITVPEAKVNDTFRANLIYDLIARDKVGDQYIQTVNKFHYHAFWLRDSSYIARMYDLSGYPDFARQVLDFFSEWQEPDGNFVSQGGQFDGWGQAMWAYGRHYRITHDRAFAERVYPAMQKAVAWLKQARANDPQHLMPGTKPGDNERIEGHITGHNFWALAGLKNVIVVARDLGHEDDAQAYQAEYDDFTASFLAALKKITVQTGGYMPPGLDQLGGDDWGNMLGIYPEQVLDPMDAMVTATLRATRTKYQEGIMTYGDGRWLHHYLTMENTETETIRGDQAIAVQELYALLLHTSSTHAGFEFSVFPWGDRDFASNLSPHGWFAAKFRAALRNMMVREQGNDLHLLSVVSPEWVKPGGVISVKRAPTDFGQVNFELKADDKGATLSLENHFSGVAPDSSAPASQPRAPQPSTLILHLPWFLKTTSVVADGRALKILTNTVVLPAIAKNIRISWTKHTNAPQLSYQHSVNQYKAEYRRRYAEWQRTGQPTR